MAGNKIQHEVQQGPVVGFLQLEKIPCIISYGNNMQISILRICLEKFDYLILASRELGQQRGMFVNSPRLLDFFQGKQKGKFSINQMPWFY